MATLSQNISPGSLETDQFSRLWQAALEEHARITGMKLDEELKLTRTAEFLDKLRLKEVQFADLRGQNQRFFHAIQSFLAPLEDIGDIIAAIISPIFPPITSIMSAILLLVRAGRRVSAAFDIMIELFDELGMFMLRLDAYKTVDLNKGMREVIIKVLTTIMTILALSTKLINQGSLKSRLIKFSKSLLSDDKELSGQLAALRSLTSYERMMVGVQTLEEVHATRHDVSEMLSMMRLGRAGTLPVAGKSHNSAVLERTKAALDPKTNSNNAYTDARDNRMEGSCTWLDHFPAFKAWHSGQESFLWIHGGPGSGKSHLAAKIVEELTRTVEPSTTTIGYFFCKVNDEQLRTVSSLVKTIIWQIAMANPQDAGAIDSWCQTHEVDDVRSLWLDVLLHLFGAVKQRILYVVIDGFDEAFAKDQAEFVAILKQTFIHRDQHGMPEIRIALVSRSSLRELLEHYELQNVLEIELSAANTESDILIYISDKLQKSHVFRKSTDFRNEIVQKLYQKAGGLWVWARMAVDQLLMCRTKSTIRRALEDLPTGIEKMLQHECQRLATEHSPSDEAMRHLNILLEWVTCAQRPLTLFELRKALELDIGEAILGLRNDISNTYSSLLKFEFMKKSSISQIVNFHADDYMHTTSEADSSADEASDESSINSGCEDDKLLTVSFHHASFYDYFRNTKVSGMVGVDIYEGNARILKTLLLVLCHDEKKYGLKAYADKYFPAHFENADPLRSEESTQGAVAAGFTKMFTSKSVMHMWATEEREVKTFTMARWRGYSEISDFPKFWLDPYDGEARAIATLRWIHADINIAGSILNAQEDTSEDEDTEPRSLEEIWDRDIDVRDQTRKDVPATTLLLGRMVTNFARQWLAPSTETALDGMPQAYCEILCLYRKLVCYPTRNESSDGDYEKTSLDDKPTATECISAANYAGMKRTELWYGRLASALLQLSHLKEAVDMLLVALRMGFGPSEKVKADIAIAYARSKKYEKAVVWMESSIASQLVDLENEAEVSTELLGDLLNLASWQADAGQESRSLSTAKQAWDMFARLSDVPDLNSEPFLFLRIFVLFRRAEDIRYTLRFILKSQEKTIYGLFFYGRLMYRASTWVLPSEIDLALNAAEELMSSVAETHLSGSFADSMGSTDLFAMLEYRFWVGLFWLRRANLKKVLQSWAGILSFDPHNTTIEIEAKWWAPDWVPKREKIRKMLLKHFLNDSAVSISEIFDFTNEFGKTLFMSHRVEQRKALQNLFPEPLQGLESNMVIFNWYSRRFENDNALNFLRARIWQAVELLSKDEPESHGDAYSILLTTLFVSEKDEADLFGALYLAKLSSFNEGAEASTITVQDPSEMDGPHETLRQCSTHHSPSTSINRISSEATEDCNDELISCEGGGDADFKAQDALHSAADSTGSILNPEQSEDDSHFVENDYSSSRVERWDSQDNDNSSRRISCEYDTISSDILFKDDFESASTVSDAPSSSQPFVKLKECDSCYEERETWAGWYICRSCPLTILCSFCLGLLQSGNLLQGLICNSNHSFFHTGPELRADDIVPAGKVPVGGEVISISDWRMSLTEKWQLKSLQIEDYDLWISKFISDVRKAAEMEELHG